MSAARLLVVFAASCLATLATALAGPRTPDETTIAFYRRVRPPGVWGTAANACGDDVHEPLARLGRGALAVVTTTAAAFCTLVGLGTWWLDATVPAGIPRVAWIAGVLAAACVSAIFAWRAVARLDDAT